MTPLNVQEALFSNYLHIEWFERHILISIQRQFSVQSLILRLGDLC